MRGGGGEEWELALARFAKFIAERDPERDTFPQGSHYLNLAICHYKLGHIGQGSENLEITMRNKWNFPTPGVGIAAGFQMLVTAAIIGRDEQQLLDFIGKNRGEPFICPHEAHANSPVFMKLAGNALGADTRRAALALHQLIPSTDILIDDIRAKLRAKPLQTLPSGLLPPILEKANS